LIFKLTGRDAKVAAIKAITEAPIGWVVRITEPTRSLEANALLHAELQEVSEQVKWAGQYLSVDDWKRLLTAAWMRATGQKVTLLPAVDGNGFDALYRRTSLMTKTEMNELIGYIQAWKADKEELQHDLQKS
jgi:hypothetical protein